MLFLLIDFVVALIIISRPVSIATMDKIPGVPMSNLFILFAASYLSENMKGNLCPNQPLIGFSNLF